MNEFSHENQYVLLRELEIFLTLHVLRELKLILSCSVNIYGLGVVNSTNFEKHMTDISIR